MIVKVTQSDIDTGRKGSSYDCMVARALNRATGQLCVVSRKTWRYYGEYFNLKPFPKEVVENIDEWDSGCHVEPFEFEIPE